MGELVRGGESPAMANADQQGMQAPEKYQGWKPAKKESRGFIRRVGQALPDGVVSSDTHEIAPSTSRGCRRPERGLESPGS